MGSGSVSLSQRRTSSRLGSMCAIHSRGSSYSSQSVSWLSLRVFVGGQVKCGGTVGWPGVLCLSAEACLPTHLALTLGWVAFEAVSPGTSLYSILCEPQASASHPLRGSQLDPRRDFAAEK